MENIENNLDKPWNGFYFTKTNITMEFVEKTIKIGLGWNFDNPLSIEFINKYK